MPQTILESTTQQFLDIHDITNDLVIMKNGTTALIVSVDAMNFGLLAEEEQDAVMYAYAGLLNSLNYPIQIIIRSQTKDVTGYLTLLKEQEDRATTRKNQQRIARYREFVANLIHDRNVLDKKFYVVVPATSLELGFLSAQTVVPGSKSFDITTIEKTAILEKARNLLEPKRDHIISQFARIGLYSRQLNTQEIIQLFYTSYNPEASEGQGIDESHSYTTPLVKASIEGPIMDSTTSTASTTMPPATAQTPTTALNAAPTTIPTTAPSTAPISAPITTPTQSATPEPLPTQPVSPAPVGIGNPLANPTKPLETTNETPAADPAVDAAQQEINSMLGSMPAVQTIQDAQATPTTPTPPTTSGMPLPSINPTMSSTPTVVGSSPTASDAPTPQPLPEV